jgi:hypothetical protein
VRFDSEFPRMRRIKAGKLQGKQKPTVETLGRGLQQRRLIYREALCGSRADDGAELTEAPGLSGPSRQRTRSQPPVEAEGSRGAMSRSPLPDHSDRAARCQATPNVRIAPERARMTEKWPLPRQGHSDTPWPL